MRFLKIFSILVVVSAFLYLISFASDDSIYNDVIRFHVIANSDSEEDQEIKLAVRDMVIEKYSALLSGYTSRDEALAAAREAIPDIEADVNLFLNGKVDYKCSVTIKEEYFPTKVYGEYSLPNGNYTALCIRLGRAEGENFWCVLFPPLCLGVSTSETDEDMFVSHGMSKEEYELMKKQKPVYKLKFRFLEVIFGKG